MGWGTGIYADIISALSPPKVLVQSASLASDSCSQAGGAAGFLAKSATSTGVRPPGPDDHVVRQGEPLT
jgi:hypothetical protein